MTFSLFFDNQDVNLSDKEMKKFKKALMFQE